MIKEPRAVGSHENHFMLKCLRRHAAGQNIRIAVIAEGPGRPDKVNQRASALIFKEDSAPPRPRRARDSWLAPTTERSGSG